MRKKISVINLIIVILVLILTTPVFAIDQNIVDNTPTIHISGPKDILVLTEDDIVNGYNFIIPPYFNENLDENEIIEPFSYGATYKKTITIFAIHEYPNPSFEDWPQSVWYTETSPVGNTASGDLYLTNVTRVPGQGSQWHLTYSGTLSYLHP